MSKAGEMIADSQARHVGSAPTRLGYSSLESPYRWKCGVPRLKISGTWHVHRDSAIITNKPSFDGHAILVGWYAGRGVESVAVYQERDAALVS
jgi:hypothetical protein